MEKLTSEVKESLEKEIDNLRNNLTTDHMDMSLGGLMNMYQDGDLEINPEFEKLFRWSDYQKTSTIEATLLGIPFASIFVSEDEDGKWELLSGLGEIASIFSFFGLLKNNTEKNNWILQKGELINGLEGLSHQNIPLKVERMLKRSICRVEIIHWQSQYKLRYEFLNKRSRDKNLGTAQEFRYIALGGKTNKFNNFLRELAQDQHFKDLVRPTDTEIKNLYLEELVLRFLALYGQYEEITNISQHLTYYAIQASDNENYDYSGLKDIFLRTVSLLEKLDNDKIFEYFSVILLYSYQNERLQRILSDKLYEMIMIGVAENIEYYEQVEQNILRQKINEIHQQTNPYNPLTDLEAMVGIQVNQLEAARKIFKVQ